MGSEHMEGEPAPSVAARSLVRLASQKLGGKKLLGVDVSSEVDFVELIERGLPLASLSVLAEREGLGPDDIDRLIIPRRTLSHRKARNQPLNRTESERAIRIASLTSLAEETFANSDKARIWLRRETAALGDRRPLDLLETEPGARMVEQLLYRIGHGVAA